METTQNYQLWYIITKPTIACINIEKSFRLTAETIGIRCLTRQTCRSITNCKIISNDHIFSLIYCLYTSLKENCNLIMLVKYNLRGLILGSADLKTSL